VRSAACFCVWYLPKSVSVVDDDDDDDDDDDVVCPIISHHNSKRTDGLEEGEREREETPWTITPVAQPVSVCVRTVGMVSHQVAMMLMVVVVLMLD
jgi:hypothetical protein